MDTGQGEGVILPQGVPWMESAGDIILAGVHYLAEVVGHSGHGQLVWGQSVSLVVILAEVRWSGSQLGDSGPLWLGSTCAGSLTWVSQSGGYSG